MRKGVPFDIDAAVEDLIRQARGYKRIRGIIQSYPLKFRDTDWMVNPTLSTILLLNNLFP